MVCVECSWSGLALPARSMSGCSSLNKPRLLFEACLHDRENGPAKKRFIIQDAGELPGYLYQGSECKASSSQQKVLQQGHYCR